MPGAWFLGINYRHIVRAEQYTGSNSAQIAQRIGQYGASVVSEDSQGMELDLHDPMGDNLNITRAGRSLRIVVPVGSWVAYQDADGYPSVIAHSTDEMKQLGIVQEIPE